MLPGADGAKQPHASAHVEREALAPLGVGEHAQRLRGVLVPGAGAAATGTAGTGVITGCAGAGTCIWKLCPGPTPCGLWSISLYMAFPAPLAGWRRAQDVFYEGMVAQARAATPGIIYFRIGTLPLTPDFGLGGAAEMGSGSGQIATYGVSRAPGGLQTCIRRILRRDGRSGATSSPWDQLLPDSHATLDA